jgi:hypothetical protein
MYGAESDQTSNNRMELTAPIMALEALTRSAAVHLYTDSTYVRNGITKWILGWATGEERRPLAAAPSGVRPTPGRVVLGQGARRHRGQRTGRRTGNAGYAGSGRHLEYN